LRRILKLRHAKIRMDGNHFTLLVFEPFHWRLCSDCIGLIRKQSWFKIMWIDFLFIKLANQHTHRWNSLNSLSKTSR
jgi:hypothetical protein